MRYKKINLQVGNVLKKYREAKGMTQEEFSELVGLTRAYYGKIEIGKHSLTIEKCYMICNNLNIRMDDIFSEIEVD